MRLLMEPVQAGAYRVIVELHTDDLNGATVSSSAIFSGFDTMTVRYDPVNHTVTGLYDGLPIGTLPHTAAGINYVGFEAAASQGGITVDNFLVKASN
jgi:hypothetical protein